VTSRWVDEFAAKDEVFRHHIFSKKLGIGNTPLYRFEEFEGHRRELYAKLEWYNFTGSVKARPVLEIFIQFLERGNGRVLLDSSSGNAGIAYAGIGHYLGTPVTIVMPKMFGEDKVSQIRSYGGRIIFSKAEELSDGAIDKAIELATENPDMYFYANQYDNEANQRAHEKTGDEIWKQTMGRITKLVATIGTGGTISGAGRKLKKYNPEIEVIAVEPEEDLHDIEGLKNLKVSKHIPKNYDSSVIDRTIRVKTEEAYKMVKQVRKRIDFSSNRFKPTQYNKYGYVGLSSGAAMVASLELMKEIDEGVIVTIFADSGDKYLPLLSRWDSQSNLRKKI